MTDTLRRSFRPIGIIACSAEGAALCYRTVCTEAEALCGPSTHPEVSLHSLSLAEYVACLNQQDLKGVADLMMTSARKLASIGAKLLICPDNTIHQAWEYIEPNLPLLTGVEQWLHIARDVVVPAAQVRGFRRAALLGTKWLLTSDVYPGALTEAGIGCVLPMIDEQNRIHQIITTELLYGNVTPESLGFFTGIIERMRNEDECDCVILGYR